MALLIGIAFLAGVITAISPCVLPVLPIVVAGSAAGGRQRPFALVAGLAVSFAVFTLFAAWVLDTLGLPDDLLRDVALGLLFLVAAALVFPRLGDVLERPFRRFGRVQAEGAGGGFLLGASLGLVFTPCAGPILAFITVSAASLDFGWRTFLLTAAYSLGAATVLLVFAVLGQRAAERTRVFRARAREVRVVLGVIIAAAALAVTFDLDRKAQLALGDYTGWFQDKTEKTAAATRELSKVSGAGSGVAHAAALPELDDFGPAPEFREIVHWLNTPNERPLSLEQLRGKVVLIDFWTYSCINCLRTLPHVRAWWERYREAGLVIVGVHTPEFAFERDLGNVREATRDLSVRYPVALDNRYGTWNAYSNRYWPAKYLIDYRGHVRYAHFGEGEYDRTERVIRALLLERSARLPHSTAPLPDETPSGPLTPETYLGWSRLSPRYTGSPVAEDRPESYTFPATLPTDGYAYAGRWRVESERIVAGAGARLRLRFHARLVHLVLAGRGAVDVVLDGRRFRRVHVREDRLYTLVDRGEVGDGLLELRFSPGLAAYAFTFGSGTASGRRPSQPPASPESLPPPPNAAPS